jgi:hypothetical protein
MWVRVLSLTISHAERSVCGLTLGVSGPGIHTALSHLLNYAGPSEARTGLGDTMKTALNSGTQ